jgi:acetyl esterase
MTHGLNSGGDLEPNPEVRRLLGLLDVSEGVVPILEPAELRLAAKAFSEKMSVGEVGDLLLTVDVVVEGSDSDISTRVYEPTGDATDCLDVIVFFHGGGWTVGDLDTADGGARALASALDSRVVSVDYRLAPENPFPAAFEDGLAVLRHVANQRTTRRVVLAGESAGGNLAASVALALRDEPCICGQILINPVLDLMNEAASYRSFGEGYFLTTEIMRRYKEWYVGQADPSDERISPLLAETLAGAAPAVIVTAGFDPLLDEGAAYAVRLVCDGVPVNYIPMSTMLHGWFALLKNSEFARHEFGRLVDGARALLPQFHAEAV